MSNCKGKIKISGKEYDCEVRDGVRYIDGVTADEFIQRLPLQDQMKLALTGAIILNARRDGIDLSPKQVIESMDKQPN